MKHFIFDLYGTLIDIRTDEESIGMYETLASRYSAFGADYRPEELKETYFRMVQEESDRIGGAWPEPDVRTVFWRMLEEKNGHCAEPEEWVKETAWMFRTLSLIRRELFPGARELLQRLKEDGYGIYLLSNAQSVFTVPELSALSIDSCFDGIFLSSDYRVRKPARAFTEELLKTYGLNREDCTLIGNDFRTDLKAADEAGIRGIFINSDGYTKKEITEMKLQYNEKALVFESIRELTEEECYARLAE